MTDAQKKQLEQLKKLEQEERKKAKKERANFDKNCRKFFGKGYAEIDAILKNFNAQKSTSSDDDVVEILMDPID